MLKQIIKRAITKEPHDTVMQRMLDKSMSNLTLAGVTWHGTPIPFNEERASIITNRDTKVKDTFNLEEAIYNSSVLKAVGADFTFGLSNTITVPIVSKLQSGWVGEIDSATDAFSKMQGTVIKPHRLSTYVTVSNLFFNQVSGVERQLSDMLAIAINEKLESTIFSSLAVDNAPKNLINPATATVVETYADICNLEDFTDSFNATYVLSKAAKKALRQMPKGNGYVMENGLIDGTKTVTSANVEDGYLLYGDFTKLKVCVWGDSLDIVCDTVTEAKDGNVRIVLNVYVDYYLTNGAAIAVGKI